MSFVLRLRTTTAHRHHGVPIRSRSSCSIVGAYYRHIYQKSCQKTMIGGGGLDNNRELCIIILVLLFARRRRRVLVDVMWFLSSGLGRECDVCLNFFFVRVLLPLLLLNSLSLHKDTLSLCLLHSSLPMYVATVDMLPPQEKAGERERERERGRRWQKNNFEMRTTKIRKAAVVSRAAQASVSFFDWHHATKIRPPTISIAQIIINEE